MDDDHRDEKMVASAKNEEEVIDRSLARAVEEAGRENVYLVADACTDRTVRYASCWIGSEHVHEVERLGKGPAVMKAIRHGPVRTYCMVGQAMTRCAAVTTTTL
jgi:hypothetical protein